MSNDFESDDSALGRGIAFPLQLERGQIGLNAFDAQVRQSILLILGTAPGERTMRPAFGGGMQQLAFEPVNRVTAALLQHRLKAALAQFEPRIDVLDVGVSMSPDAGEIRADIAYRVRRTNSVFNLVYPYYVEQGAA